MPTIRGWGALGASLALVVLWAAFGEDQLLALGAFLFAAVVVAMLVARIRRFRPDIARRVAPRRVFEGDHATVHLTVTPRRFVPGAEVLDAAPGAGGARFRIDRATPGTPLVGRYDIVATARGIYQIGPARVRVHDPLRLATSSLAAAGTRTRFVVYPRVEDLTGLPPVRSFDPTETPRRSRPAAHGGDEFFTLRDYEPGDDLRRVHWPTSARQDRLMVRQNEPPGRPRSIVFLDRRAATYPDALAFETAVRGAASVLRHLFLSGFRPIMSTGDVAASPPFARTLETGLERLAVVDASGESDLVAATGRLRRSGQAGGFLVAVTGTVDAAIVAALTTLETEFDRIVLLAAGDASAARPLIAVGVKVVAAPAGTGWAAAWSRSLESSWSPAPVR